MTSTERAVRCDQTHLIGTHERVTKAEHLVDFMYLLRSFELPLDATVILTCDRCARIMPSRVDARPRPLR